jgi:hypothetical protein
MAINPVIVPVHAVELIVCAGAVLPDSFGEKTTSETIEVLYVMRES